MSRLTTVGQPREFVPGDVEQVVAALRTACYNHPQERIAQVIVNAVGRDPFYMEDADLIKKLQDYQD